MYRKNSLQSKRGGFSMVLVLCAIILLLIIGASLLSLGTHRRMLGVRTSSEIAARAAADAGLTKALVLMNQQLEAKTWNAGSLPSATDEPLPNCDSAFSYNVIKTTTEDGNDLYNLECIGKSGRFQKTVHATLELKGLFEYAIFVANQIMLRNGTTITAYNQKPGDPPLQIGTNSTSSGAIIAKTGVTIDGDVIVGVNGDTSVVIDNKTEAAIKGKSYSSLVKNKTPGVKVPQYLQDMASSGIITTSKTINSSAKYDGINLTGSGSLINVNAKNVVLYVTGDLRLGNSDTLQIQPDASLIIYLGGNLLVDNGGAINNLTQIPKQLIIYGLDTCTNIDFKNSGSFYGAIYAPEADIHLYNNVKMHGAVVGKSFIQDVNANFYYDMSLREAAPSDIGVHMVIKRWSEL